MFKSLQDFFTKTTNEAQVSEKEAEHQLQLAAAALMFELVRSDGDIDKVELVYMAEILRKQFGLTNEELDTLFNLSKKKADDATDLHSFTRQICDKWGNAKRMKLIENLWLIALADKTIDAGERHLVRKVAGLLYMTEMQIVQSRENAKRQLNIEDF